jgi:hypothetical protein
MNTEHVSRKPKSLTAEIFHFFRHEDAKAQRTANFHQGSFASLRLGGE